MDYRFLFFVPYYLRKKVGQKLGVNEKKHAKYAGKNKISLQEGNDYIFDLLQRNEPFMVGRYGAVELSIVKWYIAQKLKLKKEFSEAQKYHVSNHAGFFSTEQKMMEKFSELMLEMSEQVDLLALFYSEMEEYMAKYFMNTASVLVPARGLEPWYVDRPWTRGLADKKVLIIHPFETTIVSQYTKREALFPNREILPKFELRTLKAVQTIAGEKDARFENWFDALEYMYEEALKIDFDVTIIGCGAYGFPLAAKLKAAGKQAIHMGGATQYLFGIKSKRADDGNPVITGMYNDAWVRPSEEERPKNAHKVEGGCYW